MRSKEKMSQVTTAAKAERVFTFFHDGEGRLIDKAHFAQARFTAYNTVRQARYRSTQMLKHFCLTGTVSVNLLDENVFIVLAHYKR